MRTFFKTLSIYKIPLIIIMIAILAILALFITFQSRSPVLIVSEEAFIVLYGKERIKKEILYNSLTMFRRVKMVILANDAGDDIVPHAVTLVSSRPLCVLFPSRFSRSAKLYKEQNPDIPAIILAGRYTGNIPGFDYIYKTDIENDFKKAGLAALQIAGEGRIAVFLESSIEKQAKEAFLDSIGEEKTPNVRFYTSYSANMQTSELSCAVLSGIGGEFIEGNEKIPIILISWLNPVYLPSNIVLIINDSPTIQVGEVVRLLSAGEKEGRIESKIIAQNSKNIDRKILRKIRKIR